MVHRDASYFRDHLRHMQLLALDLMDWIEKIGPSTVHSETKKKVRSDLGNIAFLAQELPDKIDDVFREAKRR